MNPPHDCSRNIQRRIRRKPLAQTQGFDDNPHIYQTVPNSQASPALERADELKQQPYTMIQKSDSITMARRNGGFRLYIPSLRSWMAELICCLVAILLLMALCVMLRQFDNQARPNWPSGLTLNTVVAVISTLSRIIIIVPISSGLLQLKWNWFAAGRRPLRDIYVFDQAGRGSWMTFQLIPRLCGRYILFGLLGLIVFTASLATSFITQSTISYSTRLVSGPDNRAVSLASQSFPSGIDPDKKLPLYFAGEGMLRAAQRSILYSYDANESWPILQPHCPTANCRWPLFNTLDICVSIGNVTEYLIELPKESRFVTLPYGLGNATNTLNIVSPGNTTSPPRDGVNLYASQPLFKWDNMDIVNASIAQAFFLYTVPLNSSRSTYEAMEVIWHFCVNTYNTSVVNNIPKTQLVESEIKITMPGFNDYTLIDKAGKQTFNVSMGGMNIASWQLPNTILGNWGLGQSSGIRKKGSTEFTSQIGKNLFHGTRTGPLKPPTETRIQLWNNLKTITGTMAQAMGEFMRSHQVNGNITGESFDTETYIIVRWSWISFLSIQIGLTLVFVAFAAIDTAQLGVPIIKSSNLGELFALHHHSESLVRDSNNIDQQSGIGQTIHNGTYGRLVNNDNNWHLELDVASDHVEK